MKNIDNGFNVFQKVYDRRHKDNDKSKEQLYWDGYRWVEKEISNTTYDIMKPGRSVLISNIPLHYNILANDFKEFLIERMYDKNIISSSEKSKPEKLIKGLELNLLRNSAVITMESIEMAKRMSLLDGLIVLGHTIRLSPYIETQYEENTYKGNYALAESADISAKSDAVAFAALMSLTGTDKDKKKTSTDLALVDDNNKVAILGNFRSVSLNLNKGVSTVVHSVLKVMNIFDSSILKISDEEYSSTKVEVKNQFLKFGKIEDFYIISRRSFAKLGADLGSIFIMYEDKYHAETAFNSMQGQTYKDKEIKLIYFNKDVFLKEIKVEKK